MKVRAKLFVVANNGHHVEVYNVTDTSEETLQRVAAKFDESETRLYEAAKREGGLSPGQILAIIAGRKNVFRAYELMSEA